MQCNEECLDHCVHLSWAQIQKIVAFAISKELDQDASKLLCVSSSTSTGIGESAAISYKGRVIDITEYERW